jgi:hypothetical protein
MQVDLGKAVEDLPENPPFFQALDLVSEEELVEKDVADIGWRIW